LALLAVPELLEQFLEFKRERADGRSHQGIKVFSTQVKALLHPERGFLTQRPEFVERLPPEFVAGRDWATLCEQARSVMAAALRITDEQSRVTSDPIRVLLDQDEPLAPVLAAIQRLEQASSLSTKYSREWLRAKRNALILALLVSNPLRASNYVTMTVTASSAGHVRRSEDGLWFIVIPGARFKNRRRIGSERYEAPVPEWVGRMLDEYVQDVRPRLLRDQTAPELLLTDGGRRLDGLSKLVLKLTARLIPGCAGFGPHAFRHLVATAWLRKHPSDYVTVAELLNDSLSVVMSNYAHLRKADSFSRLGAHLSEVMSRPPR
jgi:integrase